ncbi:uncharacterized protein LOC135702203 [Ochlerotatus camptorhynchus]|uniref:uncharacterized protein LOC135702203 n=1 Tax=Ochlerotatus camptorhynchus TaxID=644619 RepID=UPI0031D26E6D
MEQFSHDLTIALEETSRCGETKNRWGMRRRTRSTGNLPCAPQPTEDSSSSPADQLEINTSQNSPQLSGANNHIQSDSDDRHTLAFAFRSRQTTGNFESDSFNENFSPARPNMRRKRKFKRMAVGYEPSLTSTSVANSSIFPVIVKKRAFNHENLRGNIFFCGKRKRSHRDRYFDYESYKQHSSSLPRQRDLFAPKSSSYLEGKGRNRASSFSSGVTLNRSIISKIEKMSQTSERNLKLCFQFSTPSSKKVDVMDASVIELHSNKVDSMCCSDENEISSKHMPVFPSNMQALSLQTDDSSTSQTTILPTTQKTNSFEPGSDIQTRRMKSKRASKSHKVKHSQKQEMMQLQFDDRMSCNMNDLLSSSSLSSSDSEAVNTNESDHEGDDELTDWPGNEGMVNFTSKNDFKRANKARVMKPSLPQIKQQDDIQDDDTLMSTDDNVFRKLAGYETNDMGAPSHNHGNVKYSPGSSEDLPLDQQNSMIISSGYNQTSRFESTAEMSNNYFSSQDIYSDIREIRAGCRRIRDERPGFSIISSANELLARFLQNDQQQVLTLFDINATEHDNLYGLSKLYSLTMQVDNGCVVLSKTSNTMQSVRVDHTNLPKSIGDFKRRCYGDTEELHFSNLPE